MYLYMVCFYVCYMLQLLSTRLFVYSAEVFHPAWEEGEVEEGGGVGGGSTPSAPPSGTGVRAHETAGVLQKPIIEAPGPPPGCLQGQAAESVVVSAHR